MGTTRTGPEFGLVIRGPGSWDPFGMMLKIQVMDDRKLREIIRHSRHQETFQGDKGLCFPLLQHTPHGRPKPPLQKPWSTARDTNPPHLDVGTQMEQLIVRSVHQKEEFIVGTQTHQCLETAQREFPNALKLPWDQQPTVQGNARHSLKGTASAHYLRGGSRPNF